MRRALIPLVACLLVAASPPAFATVMDDLPVVYDQSQWTDIDSGPELSAQTGPEADHDCLRATVDPPQRVVTSDGAWIVHAQTIWKCHNGTGIAGIIDGMASTTKLQVKRDGVNWLTVDTAVGVRESSGSVYPHTDAHCATMLRGVKAWRTLHYHASAVRRDNQAVIRGVTAGTTRYLPCA